MGWCVLVPQAAAAPPSEPAPTGPNADIELSWQAPATCPDHGALLGEIAEYRVGQSRRDDVVQVAVEVSQPDAATWMARVRIKLDGDALDRRFAAESCEVLASGVALLVAVAVDPAGMSEEVEPEEVVPRAEPDSSDSSEPAGSDRSDPPPPSVRDRLQGVARAYGGGTVGDLPGLGPAVGGALGMQLGSIRWSLFGRYVFARDELRDGSGGADFTLWSVGGRACWVFAPTRVRALQIPLCAQGAGGQLSARGKSLETERSARAGWGELALAAGLTVLPTPGFGFVLEAEGFATLTRPAFVIDDLGVLYRPAAGGVRVWLGVEFQWGNNLWARRPKGG